MISYNFIIIYDIFIKFHIVKLYEIILICKMEKQLVDTNWNTEK